MKDKIIVLLTVIFAILSCIAIGHGDTTLVPRSIPSLVAWLRYFVALLAFFLILSKGVIKSRPLFFRMVLIGITSLLTVFHLYNRTVDFLTIVGVIPMLIFCLVSDADYYKAYSMFRKILVVISIFSIIIYIDYLFLHTLPHRMVPYYGTIEGFYIDYTFSYLTIGEDGIRSCAFFNEPGYFGTVLALILISEKLNFKRSGNIILFVAGILTMSMAFWALLIIGLFIYTLKTWKTRVFAVLLALTFFTVVNTVKFSDPVISSLVERFQYDSSTGSFKGDNRRTGEFEQVFERFKNSDKVLFGYGSGYYSSLQMERVATYQSQIMDWGYVGFILTYGFLVLGAFILARKDRNACIFVFCFMVSIYQRPNVFTFVYLLILFGAVLSPTELRRFKSIQSSKQ